MSIHYTPTAQAPPQKVERKIEAGKKSRYTRIPSLNHPTPSLLARRHANQGHPTWVCRQGTFAVPDSLKVRDCTYTLSGGCWGVDQSTALSGHHLLNWVQKFRPYN